MTDDELFIRRMLEQYVRHNDDRALDRLVSLFAPDAIVEVDGDHATAESEFVVMVRDERGHPEMVTDPPGHREPAPT